MKTLSPRYPAFRLLLVLVSGGLASGVGGFAAEPADSKPKIISIKGDAIWGSLAELEAAVKKGNPKAKVQLGELMLRGDSTAGAKRDPARAFALLDEAARAGEASAAFRIGMTLLEDDVADADPARAMAYLRAAAAGGHDEAFRNVGVLYSTGRGVKRDYAEALAWFILAEKHDTAESVGADLRKYLTKVRRPELIVAGEKRAPLLEGELAGTTLAKALPAPAPFAIHTDSEPLKPTPLPVPGIARDDDATPPRRGVTPPGVKLVAPTGRPWQWASVAALEREAEEGKPDALAALGQVLLEGRLRPEDPPRAVTHLEKAAAAGSADAAQLLADLYTKGTRIQGDNTKAFTYTLQAARGGVLTATHNLGALYASGRGTAVNYPEALTWLTVAHHFNRDSGSLKQVRDYLQKTHPEQVAPAEKRAAAQIAEIEKLRADLPGR